MRARLPLFLFVNIPGRVPVFCNGSRQSCGSPAIDEPRSYCCADGKVGLRSDLKGSEQWRSLDDDAARDTGAAGPSSLDGGALCVDKFMSATAKHVEDLFVEHHVDIHITAHQHVYERTTPVYRYQAYGNGSEAFPAGNRGDVFGPSGLLPLLHSRPSCFSCLPAAFAFVVRVARPLAVQRFVPRGASGLPTQPAAWFSSPRARKTPRVARVRLCALYHLALPQLRQSTPST